MTATAEAQLNKLDELLAVLTQAPKSDECRNAEEHAQGARTYLLGSMPEEYALNLEMTRQAVSEISDKNVREKAESILSGLPEK